MTWFATIQRLDIQGAGPNSAGPAALLSLARWVRERLDVDELRVEGSTRASGAGPGRRPAPSYSGELATLILRREGRFDKRITAIKRLRAAGLTLNAAHAVVTRLADVGMAVCRIAEGADIPLLARDLSGLDVRVYRKRELQPGLIAEVRTRRGLSQREFAELLGLDVDTLQNWEQGRNKPDPAALRLVLAFDTAPGVIEAASLELVG